LGEFVLLVAGCVLLFGQKRAGFAPFVSAAILESVVYVYVMINAPVVITMYYFPAGTVFAAVTGVGALLLASRPLAGKNYLSSG